MRLTLRQGIDGVLGGLLLVLCILPVRLAGMLLRRNHDLENPKHILIIKILGGGSLLLSLPAILSIKSRYPTTKISLLCGKGMVPFAKAFQIFDQLRVIDDETFFSLIRSLITQWFWIARNVDIAVDLEIHSKLTTLYSTLSLVRNRIGFVDSRSMWRRRLYTHVIYFNFQSPLYVFYDSLAYLLKGPRVSIRAVVEHLGNALQSSEVIENVMDWARPVVAIGMGCSDLSKERELTSGQWIAFLKNLMEQQPNCQLAFLGGEKDWIQAEKVITGVGAGTNLCGKLSVGGSCRVLTRAHVFLGIDSFLLHAARFLTTRVVGFWGPTRPEHLLRPMEIIEFQKALPISCSPCVHVALWPPCRGNNLCMVRHEFEEALVFLKSAWQSTVKAPAKSEIGGWVFYPDQAAAVWISP